LREGFANGKYDATREKRLCDVAQEIKAAVPTVQTRYQSAFQLIVGLDYEPEVWAVLFGPLKIPASLLARWRKKKGARQPNQCTETRLFKRQADESDEKGTLNDVAFANDHEKAYAEFKMDVQSLAEKGKTDEEIAVELDVSVDAVRSFREHLMGDT